VRGQVQPGTGARQLTERKPSQLALGVKTAASKLRPAFGCWYALLP
jgi:hypothetical protein